MQTVLMFPLGLGLPLAIGLALTVAWWAIVLVATVHIIRGIVITFKEVDKNPDKAIRAGEVPMKLVGGFLLGLLLGLLWVVKTGLAMCGIDIKDAYRNAISGAKGWFTGIKEDVQKTNGPTMG